MDRALRKVEGDVLAISRSVLKDAIGLMQSLVTDMAAVDRSNAVRMEQTKWPVSKCKLNLFGVGGW